MSNCIKESALCHRIINISNIISLIFCLLMTPMSYSMCIGFFHVNIYLKAVTLTQDKDRQR